MALKPRQALALALDPSLILAAQGINPDAWQREFLLAEDRRIMLLCSRGAGKSRATSAKALHRALFRPGSLILLVSRSQRQALELFRYVKEGFRAIGRPVAPAKETETQLEFVNGSRIVCLPGREENIRSYQGVALLIKDEAARIPDDLNKAVTPMLAVSRGQEVDLSTPFGQRGWFWRKWSDAGNGVRRFTVPWHQCARHTPEFVAQERRDHGDGWVRQEYECSFESLAGLVYPDFAARCAVDDLGDPRGQLVGGIDFGFRNPFAAVWGVLDTDDVLHLHGERYERQKGLHDHAAALPAGVTWYADPNHPTEINALRRAGLVVKQGANGIKAGIAAVQARIETGRLRVRRDGCPNLLAEAGLYRYDPDRPGENPVDSDNHALAALRYIVSRIDAGFVALYLRQQRPNPGPAVRAAPTEAEAEPLALRNRLRELLTSDEGWEAWN